MYAPILSVVLSAAPGGLVELASDANLRQPPSPGSYLPERGAFSFPAPYGTRGIRVTNPVDCGGSDCVNYAGYSYWRNINNHRGQSTMLVFVGLRGPGPTLFEIDKGSGHVHKVGSLFPAGSPYRSASAEGWYWSATQPTTLYMHSGSRLLRYEVVSQTFETVFEIPGGTMWQAHSSNDDLVHSATDRNTDSCVVFDERAGTLTRYGTGQSFDECQVDKSGRWLVVKEQVDGANAEDNRVFDLDNGGERVIYDERGAGGHSDTGYDYFLAEENWSALPATRLWRFADLSRSSLVYHAVSWDVGVTHIAHANARPGAPLDEQYACASHMGPTGVARANEIVCFLLDGSLTTLVVAPTMTRSGSAGGGSTYGKMPKANIDAAGDYIFWTSNMGSGRLDAFIVEVPWQKLVPNRMPTEEDEEPLPGGLGGPWFDRGAVRPSGESAGCGAAAVGPVWVAALALWLRRRRAICRSCDAGR